MEDRLEVGGGRREMKGCGTCGIGRIGMSHGANGPVARRKRTWHGANGHVAWGKEAFGIKEGHVASSKGACGIGQGACGLWHVALSNGGVG